MRTTNELQQYTPSKWGKKLPKNAVKFQNFSLIDTLNFRIGAHFKLIWSFPKFLIKNAFIFKIRTICLFVQYEYVFFRTICAPSVRVQLMKLILSHLL